LFNQLVFPAAAAVAAALMPNRGIRPKYANGSRIDRSHQKYSARGNVSKPLASELARGLTSLRRNVDEYRLQYTFRTTTAMASNSRDTRESVERFAFWFSISGWISVAKSAARYFPSNYVRYRVHTSRP